MEYVSIDIENVIYRSKGRPIRFPCAYALVKYQAGKITATCSGLIQPPENKYDEHTVQYHHIRPAMTEGISLFPESWTLIKAFVGEFPLIAHFFAFAERSILTDAITYYGLDFPNWRQCACTGEMAIKWEDSRFSKSLQCLAGKHGIPLNHHDPVSDARACLDLALIYRDLIGELAFLSCFKPFEQYEYSEVVSQQ